MAEPIVPVPSTATRGRGPASWSGAGTGDPFNLMSVIACSSDTFR